MFGNRKNFNDLFKSFDDMFEQLNLNTGEWKTKTRTSEDGSIKVTTHYWSNDPKESRPSNELEKLQSQLNVAIETEDFESAVKLRDSIKKLELNKKEIDKLELDLKKSIQDQDFEKSIELRDELKNLKK